MSNTAITPFQFEAFTVRTQMIEGEPFFCGSDVCAVLGYSNSRKAINDHCRPEGVTKRYTLTEKGEQELTFISEGNLYRLIIRSKKPEAARFEAWVCDEMLPTIRKTGSYGVQRADFSELERLANLTVSSIENKAAELRVEFKSDLRVLKESLPIDGAQAKAIHKSVRVLAGHMGGKPVHYRQAWRALYDRFEVAAHRDIPQSRYDEALEFIDNLAQAYSEPKGQCPLWEKGQHE